MRIDFTKYDRLIHSADGRVVKTKIALFRALISLLEEKDFKYITVTDLCKAAMINRKTFYVHYGLTRELYDDMMHWIACWILDEIVSEKIFTEDRFDSYAYVMFLFHTVEDNKKETDILFPYLRSGGFQGVLGVETGRLAFRFMRKFPKRYHQQLYPMTTVFVLNGLMTCFMDWIELGRQFPVEELAELSREMYTVPLGNILSGAQTDTDIQEVQ